ncbi:MAG: sigma-70 family RNA polymerase sigma factor [Anaerolineae bacterium]
MQPPLNEPDLIERASAGDRAAVSTLYDAYVQAIFAYINYRVDSGAIAEDLTADVFLRMIRALPKFQYTGAPFGAWLYRIAANRVAEYYREKQPVHWDSLLENYRSNDPDLDDQIVDEAQRSRVREALLSLPEDYQTVLILRFTQDLPHTEVASIMGKSIEAVRVLQHRALKALAKSMTQSNEIEGSE